MNSVEEVLAEQQRLIEEHAEELFATIDRDIARLARYPQTLLQRPHCDLVGAGVLENQITNVQFWTYVQSKLPEGFEVTINDDSRQWLSMTVAPLNPDGSEMTDEEFANHAESQPPVEATGNLNQNPTFWVLSAALTLFTVLATLAKCGGA